MINMNRPAFSMARVLKAVLGVLGITALVAALISVYPLLAALMPWRLVSSSSPVPLGNGVTYVVKKVTGAVETELHLVLFDTKSCDLQVVEQPLKKGASRLDEVAHRGNAIAACNGGYFDVPNFLPTGLQISGGKRVGDFVRQQFGGCVVVRGGVAVLQTVDEFKDDGSVTEFVQCSPLYVLDGRPVQIGPGGPRNTRTIILTDEAGHWAIGTCKNIGLQEMADLLSTSGIIREFTVKRALNLDGGPSTGLWWKDAAGSGHYEKESWLVKNIVLVTPKK